MSATLSYVRKIREHLIILGRYNSKIIGTTKPYAEWKCIRKVSSVCNKYVIQSTRPCKEIPTCSIDQFIWKDSDKWADKVAVECGITGRKMTYSQARKWCNCVASVLQNQMQLAPGDCFAILSPNIPEYPLLVLAGSEAGLVATTINPLYKPGEIAQQLKNSNSKLVITVPSFFPNAVAGMKILDLKLPVIVIKDSPDAVIPPGAIALDDAIKENTAQLKKVDIDPECTFLLPYSSGTSGLPKGVQIAHRNLVANVLQMDIGVLRDLRETSNSEQDVQLGLLPMFHIYGFAICIVTLIGGGKLVTIPRFEPELFIKLIVQHQIELLYLVPPLIIFLGVHPAVKPESLKFVRLIGTGAAPNDPRDIEQFRKKAPHINIFQGYGLTEMSPAALMSHEKRLHKLNSTGTPVSNTEVKVVDIETCESLPANKNGELYFRGPQVMKGYLNNPEADEEVFCDGWLRTGDVGYYDDDGDFFIVARLKELIKVKGFQVPPAELEAVLRQHPKIADAAVIGVKGDRNEEKPRAFVVTKQGETLKEEEVTAFVNGKVAHYKKLTGGVVFLSTIPKSATGKILRRELYEKDEPPAPEDKKK